MKKAVEPDSNGDMYCTSCGSYEVVQRPSQVGTNQYSCNSCARRRAKEWRNNLTPERYAQWKRRQKEFYERNPGYAFDRLGARIDAENAATPDWLTDEQWDEIDAIYAESFRMTQETGVKHHVDHIIPLRNKLVCGLHVPWNLEAIPAKDNLKKNNSFDPSRGSALFD